MLKTTHFKIIMIMLITTYLCLCVLSADSTENFLYNRLLAYNIVSPSSSGYNLNEPLTREQALALYIRTLNESERAKAYALTQSLFTDVSRSGWYNGDVVYGALKGYTRGIGKGKFGIGQGVTSKDFLTFVLRGLNYWVSDDQVMPLANDLKLLGTMSPSPYHYINRGEAFAILDRALDLPKKGSTMPLSAAFEASATVANENNKIVDAVALDINTIKITFEEEIALDERPFTLIGPDGRARVLSAHKLVDYNRTLMLTTKDLEVGKAYTLNYGSQKKTLVPLMVNYTDYPRIKSVQALTQNQLRLVLSTPYIDRSSLLPTNFALTGDVVVTDVAVDVDYMAKNNLQYQMVLSMWVTAMESGKSYTLTANNLLSYKGTSGASGLVFTSQTLDDQAPILASAVAQSSELIKLTFTDATNLDYTSIIPSNFSISPAVNIRSIYNGEVTAPGQYSVFVVTEHLSEGANYEFTVHRVSDGTNIMAGAQRQSFTGIARLLNLMPTYAKTVNRNTIEVGFLSNVHSDGLNPTWFTMESGYTVTKVAYATDAYMPDGYDKKRLWLTTQDLTEGQLVKITLSKNLKDTEGLGLINDSTLYAAGYAADTKFDTTVVAFGIDELQVKLLFGEKLDAISASNIENYLVNDSSHVAAAQLLEDQKSVLLTIPYVAKGSLVTITLNSISDLVGNTINPQTRVYCVIPQ